MADQVDPVKEKKDVQKQSVGLDPCNQEAHGVLRKAVGLQGKFKSTLGLGLASPCNFEAGECSISSPKVLDTSYQNGVAKTSSGKSEIKAREGGLRSQTRVAPTTTMPIGSEMPPIVPIGQVVTPTVPMRLEAVAHTSNDLISAMGGSNGSMLIPVGTSAMNFSNTALGMMGVDGCGGRSDQSQPCHAMPCMFWNKKCDWGH